MIIPSEALTFGGVAVSGMSLFTLDRNNEYLKSALVCGLLAALLIVVTQFHLVTLTATETTLVWFLPGLAALDLNRRAIPAAIIVPLFGFAALCHWMLFNSWLPLIVLAAAIALLFLPLGRKQFEIGDRVIVAWLLYAFGILGVVASAVAVLTAMGRKYVPFVTHVACATAVLLLPVAFVCQHFGRVPWRF